jgi:hypothetical protein
MEHVLLEVHTAEAVVVDLVLVVEAVHPPLVLAL